MNFQPTMSNLTIGEVKLRVRYAETDQMGVVYHSNFVIWFEIGRVELMRQLGFRYRDMEQHENCHIPVADMRVRYKEPAYYDDEIVVRTRLQDVHRSLLRFRYQVFRAGDEVLLAEGETTHLVVDDKLKRRSLPEKYVAAFSSASQK
ncbi:MAG TPA: thioesterase family protein [Candidatus Angelobacter sp.]